MSRGREHRCGRAGSSPPVAVHAADYSTSGSVVDVPEQYDADFRLNMRLKDASSGEWGDLTFAGKLHGDVTIDSCYLTAAFDTTGKSVVLARRQYAVMLDIGSLHIPPPDAVGITATVNVWVHVTDAGGPLSVASVPEQSGMTLAALASLGIVAYRRRPGRPGRTASAYSFDAFNDSRVEIARRADDLVRRLHTQSPGHVPEALCLSNEGDRACDRMQ